MTFFGVHICMDEITAAMTMADFVPIFISNVRAYFVKKNCKHAH